MRFDGALGDAELLRHGAVGLSRAEHEKHVEFPLGQILHTLDLITPVLDTNLIRWFGRAYRLLPPCVLSRCNEIQPKIIHLRHPPHSKVALMPPTKNAHAAAIQPPRRCH
ncbi:hypothetical protein JMUB6875_33330 [Nocardia sp. JMUB6875]